MHLEYYESKTEMSFYQDIHFEELENMDSWN